MNTARIQDARLAVVVVTYNRSADLAATLERLGTMHQEYRHLIVIDNASTDDTSKVLTRAQATNPMLEVQVMPANLGGAGGFRAGVAAASVKDVDWILISDDDALPIPGSYARLLRMASSTEDVYGCVAVVKDSPDRTLCWPIQILCQNGLRNQKVAEKLDDLADQDEVSMIPFLGFMVSKKKVQEVGLPNGRYFISGDDMEYCLRLKASGSRLYQFKSCLVEHPAISRYQIQLGHKTIRCLHMPPWRRYYDIRNRLWNARLAGGRSLALVTTLNIILRLYGTLSRETDLRGQLGAYLGGLRDGLFRYQQSGHCDSSTGQRDQHGST